MYGILDEHIFFLQKGNVLNEVPLNSTYWAPVDAHDPVRVQQIMLGLTKTSAEKMDLALARDTKICESFISYDYLLKSEILQNGIRNKKVNLKELFVFLDILEIKII